MAAGRAGPSAGAAEADGAVATAGGGNAGGVDGSSLDGGRRSEAAVRCWAVCSVRLYGDEDPRTHAGCFFARS